jgi:membrane peptidoglycan carboxypeptidase
MRLGYTRLGEYSDRLQEAGWAVEAQARASPPLWRSMDWGLFPVYREKNRAGLTVLDRDALPLYTSRFPERVYPSFEAIPPVVVRTLLYVENREALDSLRRYQNPAVEWDRLANAFLDLGLSKVVRGHQLSGGSTLATALSS